MSKQIKSSEKKIKKVFEKMFHQGISVKGDPMSQRTVTTYTDMTLAVFRDAQQEYGVENIWDVTEDQINQVVQQRIDSYHDGNLKESWNLKSICASLKAFNLGVKETNVFKEKFAVGDPDGIRDTLKEQNVIRKSGASTVLRTTPAECFSVLDNVTAKGYDTELRETAYHVGKIGLLTGGRITAILKLRAGDISVDLKKSSISYVGDKGGLTRSIKIPEDTTKYLDELKKGKKDNQYIFNSKRRDGTFKSRSETRKEISKIFADAGKHLTRVEPVRVKDKEGNFKLVDVERKFSSHCFRKAFALERTSQYYNEIRDKSDAALKRYMGKRISENPKIREKLEIVKDRINKHIPKDLRKEKGRDLTKAELAIFLTSVDLGHFRNDVITAFYTSFQEVKDYFEEKHKI